MSNIRFEPAKCSRKQMYQYIYEFLEHCIKNISNIIAFKRELVELNRAMIGLYPESDDIDLKELGCEIGLIEEEEGNEYSYYYRCEHCSKKKKDVDARIDPYEEEVNDTVVARVICEKCLEKFKLSI
jgi:hypothetical protein